MREGLLTRHFVQRFLENDLLSPDADRHDAIAMVCGGLLTLALFLSVAISMKFLFMPFQSPGRTALLAVGDRLVFISISMIVMALVAVMTWDALSLDSRDTAMFGPLPIERGLIVRAKLRAVGILACGFALAISSLSSLVHPFLMVSKLPIGLLPVFALIVIHLAVTLGAGLFAFASVVVLREVLRALLGPRFNRVSAGLQAALIVALVTGFLLLPMILERAARPERPLAQMLPPVWFAGLHEALAGGLVTGLTRGALPERVARQEDRAAALYGEISASIRPLAWRAVSALTASLAIGIAAFFWNSRQLPLPLVGHRASRYRGPGLLTRALTFTLVRRPATQAGFFFTLRCLFRSGPHRVVMAGCTAVSIALATVFFAAGSDLPDNAPRVPDYVFTTQTIALAVLLAGFRHVTRLPADIPANRLFRLAWVADSRRFLAGVRRAAFVGIVLPAVVLLLPPYLYLLGTPLASMHAVSGLLLGAALISLMTFRISQLPFVAGYAPARDLNTVGPVVVIGGLIAVSTLSRIERFALADVGSTAIFWGILALAALLPQLAAFRNTQLDLPSAFDVPSPGTTRLDLG